MKSKLFVALAASSFLLAAPALAAGNASNGGTIYSSKCSACHGTTGQGGMGPAFSKMVSDYSTADALASFIQKNMPMGAAGSLSASDAADLAAYIEQQTGSSSGSSSTSGSTSSTGTSSSTSGSTSSTGTSTSGTPASTPASSTKTGSDANLLLYVGGALALAGGAVALKGRRLVKE